MSDSRIIRVTSSTAGSIAAVRVCHTATTVRFCNIKQEELHSGAVIKSNNSTARWEKPARWLETPRTTSGLGKLVVRNTSRRHLRSFWSTGPKESPSKVIYLFELYTHITSEHWINAFEIFYNIANIENVRLARSPASCFVNLSGRADFLWLLVKVRSVSVRQAWLRSGCGRERSGTSTKRWQS